MTPDGGRQRILLSPPDVGDAEEAALIRALRSGWVAPLGPEVDAFERELADRVGVRTAVAVSSGTAALHLALVSWGVGRGDLVVTSSLTFAATANAIVYTGAEPHFVDSDATGNMDPALLDEAITGLERGGRRVGAVIPVDVFGRCADHDSIAEIATRHRVPVFVDAAESLGARGAGRPAGSHGRAAAVSFNGNKIMTTSGGGMLLTDDEGLAAHVRHLATQAREPADHYEHVEIGYNYRLSNLLAAVGRAQLGRLDGMVARRRHFRAAYRAVLDGVPGVAFLSGDDAASGRGDAEDNCWLTALTVHPARAGWSADDLRRALAGDDIESRRLWKPMHRQPVFTHCGATLSGESDHLFETGLLLPGGSSMTEDDLARIVTVLDRVAGRSVARV